MTKSIFTLIVVFVEVHNLLSGDETVLAIRHIEPATYPLAAKVARKQGLVVLRASSDPKSGLIRSVDVIDGSEVLSSAAVANLKKWRILSLKSDTFVLVYRYVLEGYCYEPCPSNFTVKGPNYVEITTGAHVFFMQ